MHDKEKEYEMTVYVLSWHHSDMDTMVFSSFEKAYQVAKFIRDTVFPAYKVTQTDQDDNGYLMWHFEYQGSREDDYDDEAYWDEMTICPYDVDSDLCYLKN